LEESILPQECPNFFVGIDFGIDKSVGVELVAFAFRFLKDAKMGANFGPGGIDKSLERRPRVELVADAHPL